MKLAIETTKESNVHITFNKQLHVKNQFEK